MRYAIYDDVEVLKAVQSTIHRVYVYLLTRGECL